MTDILCTVVGNKGHQTARQGSKTSGMLVVLQTHAQRLGVSATWNKDKQMWDVMISRDKLLVTPDQPTMIDIEQLWCGTLEP